MEKYILYEHVNKNTGKRYIGITNNKEIRWRNEGIGYKPYNGSVSRFWNAIQKYGWDSFDSNILEENLTFEEACEKEILEISKYDIRKDLYNISQGGNGGIIYLEHPRGMLGKKHSEEFKNRLREIMSGENNPFYGKNWDDYGGHPRGMLNKSHTEDIKEQISKTCKEKGINKKRVECTYPDGSVEVFNSMQECADYFNTSSSGLLFRLVKSGEPYIIKPSNTRKHLIKIPEGSKFRQI